MLKSMHHLSNNRTADAPVDNSDSKRPDENSFSNGLDEINKITNEQSSPQLTTSIAKQESADVHRFKLILILILLIVATAVSTCIHVLITKAEQLRFEQQFDVDSAKVLEAIRLSIDNTLKPMDELAVSFVSYAKDRNDTWPFVTIPDFGLRVAKVLPSTDSIWMSILPIVTPANRRLWENYTLMHDDWVENSIAIQDHWDRYYGPKNIQFDREPLHQIHGDFGPLENNLSGRHFHLYPFDDPAVLAEEQQWIENYGYFVGPDEDAYEPVMDIFYPIVNDLTRVEIAGSDNYEAVENSLVAILAGTVYWRNLIRDALPPGSNGLTVVFSNECTKSFTYQIYGPNVVFLGVDDKHEVKYDNMEVTSTISDLDKKSYVSSVYTGAPVDPDYCPYTLHLYPTDEMRSNFFSNNAIIFTSVTLLVAIGLGVLFLTYNFKVERRQKKVLQSAIRSSKIVSSLFPESVRDLLYAVEETDANVLPLQTNPGDNETVPAADVPIAKLYQETTVMFADIKGFTQWSASREPTQVFHLLETLYGGFDVLARLYCVFKVETISDTYVAVVGLPNARKHHAVVMARFATKCIEKMTELTRNLDSTLGSGTAELSLRVGLNSGPTTAGVLRGEKARFQLFGDTVNTASRMESNGESGRIHVSASTAKQIELDGKGHWMTLRETPIIVKGKGAMQTYWCDIRKTVSTNP